jgi:hypothetical protein
MWSPISSRQQIWYSTGDNPRMDLTPTQIEELEAALEKMSRLDPALLPEPASELAELLSKILDELEEG